MTPEIETSTQSDPLEIIQKGFLPNGKPLFGFVKTEAQSLPVSIRGVHPHGKINTQDAPYGIDINVPRFVELLERGFDLPRDIIERIEINIIGEDKRMDEYTKQERKDLFPYGSPIKNYFQKKFLREEDLWALVNPTEDKIFFIIYGNLLWRVFNGDKRKLADYLGRKVKYPQDLLDENKVAAIDQKTREIKVSGKRIRYLSKNSIRLDRLVTVIAKRELREAVVHESTHIDEDENRNPNSFWNKEWIGRVLYAVERFLPSVHEFLEGKAERKEKELGKKHDYFDLIDFKINKPSQIVEPKVLEPQQAA